LLTGLLLDSVEFGSDHGKSMVWMGIEIVELIQEGLEPLLRVEMES